MKNVFQNRFRPLVYLITDRTLLQPTNAPEPTFLIEFIEFALAAGVDLIQIRERDLPAREVSVLAVAARDAARQHGGTVLVNDRADIAAASEIGVHLTTRSLEVNVVRRTFGAGMIIGASTHNLQEIEAAQGGGADFVVFGPVFETASKRVYGEPVGLEALRRAVECSRIPVLALGGVNPSNFRETLTAGAAGVAGISMFTTAADLRTLVAAIKDTRP